MFRLDESCDRIPKLQPVRFSNLGFDERMHLQEWIANEPEALGRNAKLTKPILVNSCT